jgi:hypothetical protein
VKVLTSAPPGVAAVALKSGELISAYRVIEMDGSTAWDGDRLKLAPASRTAPLIDALITERRRETADLEEYRDYLARGAPGLAPGESEAVDIPVQRPGQGDD